MKRHTYPLRCRCVTRWLVDFGDARGEQPVPALTAAMASPLGLSVRLANVSSVPVKPIHIPGVSYASSTTMIRRVCNVCGFPTLMEKGTSAGG